jgi:uncharacterized protein with gpF-like domain
VQKQEKKGVAVSDNIPDPVEAKKYLARKAIVETEKWDELKWGEHAHAFTVAHSRNAAVLNDIFGLLNTAMADGKSFNKFKQEMHSLMEDKGWYGRSDKGPNDKDYINWRIGLIYHVNMRTAYEAGRYRQQVRGAGLRPIWEYVSKLVGKNRREEHVSMHGKAFRWDDPFWNENRPPNGWGCECSVVTLSEAGAEREGIEILKSDPEGNPPALIDRNGNAVDWKNFTPETWRYSPGREALAPNFANYTNLSREALQTVMGNYNRNMKDTVINKEEWMVIAKRANEPDYKPTGAMFQIGNLTEADYTAVRNKAGVFDSKIMATDHDLWHSSGNKQKRIQEARTAHKPQDEIQRLINQAVDVKDFETVYKTYSAPEQIFLERIENKKRNETNVYLHFTKGMGDGKTLRIIFHARDTKKIKLYTAMQLLTMEIVESTVYTRGGYEIIK